MFLLAPAHRACVVSVSVQYYKLQMGFVHGRIRRIEDLNALLQNVCICSPFVAVGINVVI